MSRFFSLLRGVFVIFFGLKIQCKIWLYNKVFNLNSVSSISKLFLASYKDSMPEIYDFGLKFPVSLASRVKREINPEISHPPLLTEIRVK